MRPINQVTETLRQFQIKYKSLLEEFDYRLEQASNFMPVYKINTANYNEQQTFEQAKKLIKL